MNYTEYPEEYISYIKSCKLYPDGKIRDPEGKVVGGIDTDSETFKEIFSNSHIVGFTIIQD